MPQKPITYSNSTHSTARLFFLKELFHDGILSPDSEKILIITDKDDDISLVRNFAKTITKHDIHSIESISDVWTYHEKKNGIFLIQHQLLEISGSIEYLKRQTIHEIQRWTELSMDDCIHTLIDFWYIHTDHRGELSTYKREWSTISITMKDGSLVQIEWFDTEIDSIIMSDASGRNFVEKCSLENLKPDDKKIVRNLWEVNEHIVHFLAEDTKKSKVVLFWCDFLSYIELLRSFAYIHLSDFHREDCTSLGYEIPKISHIDEFLSYSHLWKSTWANVEIYTKYVKSVQDFFEFHNLPTSSIHEIHKTWMTSFERKKWESTEIMITDDIIGNIFVRERTRKKSLAKNLDLLISLKPGDYVVHREHGIARFDQVIKKTLGSDTSWAYREYMELHYAEWDKLFVPLTEIYRVSKYLGENNPELTRLSWKEWERILQKTDEEIEEIAQDIIETTARRSIARGRSFWVFREDEKKFQDAFKYEYTIDQKTAIDEVFEDMEKEEPMDRLLSGDVGFWKTEVAMNAIYKAVLSGTQVAVISPLLVLADEHYETFLERLGPFWVRVGILTRMNTQSEAKITLEKLREWKIDILVGTHRLLSEDIIWKKLWLLVIDEEHKFWVTHKEKIKKIRANIDILALSATPIPRSLNLALSGLRKISLLTTPPRLKKPIKTIITKWHEPTIFHAIREELDRGWQVIILHNRIRGMESIEKEIGDIVKNGWQKMKKSELPKIIITHGQMPGEQIEERIHAFKKREYNILLTTTIIENGVNFLSANTIIILDPEDFWLASLHQLRGRVGRKDEEGFCYLIYRKPELAKDEKERLITIANNSHLGAGFEIAMRDLEIRGAWDVLGIKQSWKSKDVWLTLYFRMLEEKIEILRNEKKKKLPVKIELDLSFVIPEEVFLSEQDKLQFFRDIENIETLEELEEIEKDFEKIDTKHESDNLFLLLKWRIILGEYGVIKLAKVWVSYIFDFREDIEASRVKAFLERFDSKNSMVLLSLKKIRVETRYWKNSEDFLGDIVQR